MDKNSFTLFETLISIFILSIIIVSFNKSSNYDNFDKEFMLLNEIENSFTTKEYSSNFSTTTKNINILKNETIEETISINNIKYEDEKITLFKYELK